MLNEIEMFKVDLKGSCGVKIACQKLRSDNISGLLVRLSLKLMPVHIRYAYCTKSQVK